MSESNKEIFSKGFLASVFLQIISACISLFFISIGIRYFGAEVFGIWLVILSLLDYLNSSQFGIGLATSTLIARENNELVKKKIFLIAFTILSLISVLFVVIVLNLGRDEETWIHIWGQTRSSLQETAILCSIFASILFFIKLPTVAFTSALIGLQKIHWERFYNLLLPSIVGIISLLITIWAKGDLLLLIILIGGGRLIIGVLAAFHVVMISKTLFDNLVFGAIDWTLVNRVLQSGKRFFLIGTTSLIIWNTDNFVINYFLGPEQVTAYATTFRLYQVAILFIFMTNSILWPMYGKAASENNWKWINKIYNNATLILSISGGAICVGGLLFAHDIIMLWVGPSGYGGELVVIALSLYMYLAAINNCHGSLLSGINKTKALVWIGVAEAILNLILSLVLVQYFGIGGVALGTFLSALLTITWLLPIAVNRESKGLVRLSFNKVSMHFLYMIIMIVVLITISIYIKDDSLGFLYKLSILVVYLLVSMRFIPPSYFRQIKWLVSSVRSSRHL